MPIYEFYCGDCHTVFNFFSKTINTEKRPLCPRCGKRKLERQVSLFAQGGRAKESDGMGDLGGLDESKMERAIMALAGEAEKINENDPKQAAQLMRKFSNMTGVKFGDTVEQAINRMEAGEDPEKIETEMGGLMEGEGEEPFMLPDKKGAGSGKAARSAAPSRDKTLYEM